jgi:Flavin containing amine oxidoreductase
VPPLATARRGRGPAPGRVHWAGTECASEWNGYMEGAVRSGEAAAEQSPRSGRPPRRCPHRRRHDRRGAPHLITSTLLKYSGTRAAEPSGIAEQDRMPEEFTRGGAGVPSPHVHYQLRDPGGHAGGDRRSHEKDHAQSRGTRPAVQRDDNSVPPSAAVTRLPRRGYAHG